jgi:ribosomal protein S18 acetylase RimI-like enzyme
VPIRIRALRPDEHDLHEALGRLTVDAYRPLVRDMDEDGYDRELADVGGRVAVATVYVALVEPEGCADGARGGGQGAPTLLGGITHVPAGSSPLAEFDDLDAAGIRMLAVAPEARGRGVGESLVQACLDRARADGRARVVLHSTEPMTAAHRLYTRMGFERDPSLDRWVPLTDPLHLMAFRLEL